jgi:prophage maintenance system killer protein
MQAITELKSELMRQDEASGLFGAEQGNALAAILGNIEQTMFRKPLYKTRDDKVANPLYFVIKDHPFVDGNKRIGSFLCAIWPKELMKYRDNGELITRHLNAIK